jgi:hypothetical protein
MRLASSHFAQGAAMNGNAAADAPSGVRATLPAQLKSSHQSFDYSFERPIVATVDVSAFDRLAGRALHHVLEGRLNDVPHQDEPRQIGRITQSTISFDGKTLTVTLSHRSVSCIEFTLK